MGCRQLGLPPAGALPRDARCGSAARSCPAGALPETPLRAPARPPLRAGFVGASITQDALSLQYYTLERGEAPAFSVTIPRGAQRAEA